MDLIRCRVGYKGNGRSTGEYNQHRRELAAMHRALADVEDYTNSVYSYPSMVSDA